jgi:hypothetical protein
VVELSGKMVLFIVELSGKMAKRWYPDAAVEN